MRAGWGWVMGLALAGIAPGPASAAGDAPATQESQHHGPSQFALQMRSVSILVEQAEYAEASRLLAQAMAQPQFASAAPRERRDALSLAGALAITLEDMATAREYYLQAVDADPGHAEDWYWLLLLEADMGMLEEAAGHLAIFARRWPALLDGTEADFGEFDAPLFGQLVYGLDKDAPVRLELLQALFDSGWDWNGRGADELWHELALLHLRRGDEAATRATLQRMRSPDVLVALRSDARFDALFDRDDPRFDVARANAARIATLRGLADARPRDLGLRVALGYALLAGGENAEMLRLADAVLAPRAMPGPEPFDDMDELPWIINLRGIALRRLGRIDEALAQFVRAAGYQGVDPPDISHALNLGYFHCGLGNAAAAIDAIAAADHMSDYGRMVQAGIQHCAAWLQGDRDAARVALDYLREHRNDGPEMWVRALVREDRMDEARDGLLEMLASDDRRDTALELLQQYRKVAPLPGAVEVEARWDALLTLPEVLEAASRVGRVERYGLYRSTGI